MWVGWPPSVERPRRQTRRRTALSRGSYAVEFAFTLPILCVLAFGAIDYGWYFNTQAFIVNVLREAARYGSLQSPSDADGAGECTPCVTATAELAVEQLARYGVVVTTSQVTPTIESVAGSCALSLEPAIPYTPLIGLVTSPVEFDVDVVVFLQNVTGC